MSEIPEPKTETAPNTWPLPPVLTIAAILLSVVANHLLPNTWTGSGGDLGKTLFYMGVVLVIMAIALDVWAFLTFRRHHANIRPDRAATTLIMSGPFAFSRNPIYLANILLTVGLGFATDNRWMLVGAGMLYIALQEWAIKREERHMEAKFGSQWRDYAKAVRRWL